MEKRAYTLEEIQRLIQKAEKYEELERQQRLIRLPCALGSMVYHVVPDCRHCSIGNPQQCGRIMQRECHKKVMPCLFRLELLEEYGRTVFLTETEALVASVS